MIEYAIKICLLNQERKEKVNHHFFLDFTEVFQIL